MRVVLAINHLRFGGAERLVADLACGLCQRGIQVQLVALGGAEPALSDQARAAGVSVHVLGRPVYSIAAAARLLGVLRKSGADIVHAHLFPSIAYVSLARKVRVGRWRLVMTEHNTWNRRRRSALRPADRMIYRSYDRIACISDEVRDALVGWAPETAPKTVVVHNGIPASHFQKPKTGERIGHPVRILSIGRLTRQKGFESLVETMRHLPECELVIAGDGELRPELEAQVLAAGLRGRVRLIGWTGDVFSLLRTADVYVQPSRWEGFGIAAVEAMAAGLPVIVTDVAGLSKVVGSAGLRVAVDDIAGMRRTIASIVDDQPLRMELSSRGALRARSFTMDAAVAAYASLYRGLS
jgi:glycosyltransferase involved in cell wall biosynthesis